MKILNPFNRLGIIFMYHRVSNIDYDPLGLNVSPKHFEEQIQIIKKYGNPVQMQHMGKGLKRFSMGKVEIAVTLDDGYADNFYNAKSILERHNVPATFYIITGSIGSKEEFFWEGLIRTILAPEGLPQSFHLTIADKIYRWELIPSGRCQSADYSQSIKGIPPNDIKLSRYGLYDVLIRLLGPLLADQRRDALKHLAHWSSQDLTAQKDDSPMTSSDLLSLANSKIFEIGAHTVNHPHLAFLPAQKQEEEINQSKIDLENMLNKTVVSFSYPHGGYIEETVKLVERLKFQNACTTHSHLVMRNTNPYLLPRFAVEDWNGEEFEMHLRHWMAQLP